jgi:hypothetical protein
MSPKKSTQHDQPKFPHNVTCYGGSQQLKRATEGVNHSFYSYKAAGDWKEFLGFNLSPLMLNKGVTFCNEWLISLYDDDEMEFQ